MLRGGKERFGEVGVFGGQVVVKLDACDACQECSED